MGWWKGLGRGFLVLKVCRLWIWLVIRISLFLKCGKILIFMAKESLLWLNTLEAGSDYPLCVLCILRIWLVGCINWKRVLHLQVWNNVFIIVSAEERRRGMEVYRLIVTCFSRTFISICRRCTFARPQLLSSHLRGEGSLILHCSIT